MTEQANIVISIPAYISNDAADDSITVTDPISGAKAIVLATGYYEFVLNDGTGDGSEATPFHLLKKLSDGTTTNWTYELGFDGRLTIGYLGTGTATFVFANSHIQNLLGSSASTLTFTGAGEQTMAYPVYGLLISRNREGDGSWRLDPGFNTHQITADNNVYGWSDNYNKFKRKFGLRFLPKDQSFKTSTQVGTPVYPVSASTWQSGFNPLSYTAPFTAVNFLQNAKSRKLKMHLGSLPYNGTDEFFVVYQTPESIMRTNRFAPSLRANYERLLTLEDFEVLLSTSDSGEASYATGAITAEWTPLALGSLTAWYRGDVVVYDGSNKVSQWTDQSGNGRHLLQSNASYKPTFVSSIAGKNSKPGVEAVSTGEYLQCANFVISVEKTVVIVVGGFTAGSYVSALTNGGIEYFYAYHPAPATFYNKDNVGGAHYMTNTGANFFQANTDHILMYDLTTPSLYRDNVSVAGTIAGTALTAGTKSGYLSLFSAYNGGFGSRLQILEVIVYSKALNSTERSDLNTYLTARYG